MYKRQTITNPFTLAIVTTTPDTALETAVEAPVTPYATLCSDTSRPAAFTMTFVEPAAA